MQEKSLISQRLIYDSMICGESDVHNFTITKELHRNCKFAYTRYKTDLEQQRQEKVSSEKSLKRKAVEDDLQSAKKRKSDLESTMAALREGVEEETLAADKNKDLKSTAKAAAMCRDLKRKKADYEICCSKITELQDKLASSSYKLVHT